MFNPIQQGAFIACYGQYGKREECGNCLCRGFCKDAAEIPFISDTSRAGQYIDQIFSSDDPEAAEKIDVEAVPEEKKEIDRFLLRKFDCDELMMLVRFFLDLSPFEFEILRCRLANPRMTIKQLQEDLQLRSKRRVYDFFHRKCEKFPMMSEIFYINQQVSQERNLP